VQTRTSDALPSYLARFCPPASQWPLAILVLSSAFVLLWNLGVGSLYAWDEAVYAQVAKEILQTRDWLTPHYEYQVWIDKPPLLMWLTAIFFQSFGVTEFWARAASAFSGIGLVAITYAVGNLIHGRRVGLIAAAVLLTSHDFVLYARSGMTDIMLTLFTWIALYAFLRAEANGSRRWWWLVGVAVALAIMTKSLAAFVAPLVIVLTATARRRLFTTLVSPDFLVAVLIAAMIIAPWHVLMYMVHGKAFVDGYIGFHIAHFTSIVQTNTADRFFYVTKLAEGFYPWFYLLPFALGVSIKESLEGESRWRSLLLTTLVVFICFTISRTKLAWYILPLYPAIAVLAAYAIDRAWNTCPSIECSGLIVAAAVVALTVSRMVAVAFAVPVLIIGVLFVSTRRLALKPLVATLFVFLLVAAVSNIRSLYASSESPVARLARVAVAAGPADREPLIVSSGLFRPTPLFYSNRPILEARTVADVTEFIRRNHAKRIILSKADLPALLMQCDVDVVDEAGALMYAIIRNKNY